MTSSTTSAEDAIKESDVTRHGRTKANNIADQAEIVRALTLFLPLGQLTEIRAIDATVRGDHWPRTYYGYFDDAAKAAEAVAELTSATAVYFIPNIVNPALKARAVNRLKAATKNPALTT